MSFPEVWISKNNKGYLFKEDAVGGFGGFEHSYPTLEEGLKIYNGFICYYKASKRHENYSDAKLLEGNIKHSDLDTLMDKEVSGQPSSQPIPEKVNDRSPQNVLDEIRRFSTADVIEAMNREHRTIQQLFAPHVFALIENWAAQFRSGNFDLRNEETCRRCDELIAGRDDLLSRFLPYV